MNIKSLHTNNKPISAIPFFKNKNTNVVALQILKDALLKEHISKVPATLLCLSGKVSFHEIEGQTTILEAGAYQDITPHVKHEVKGIEDSQLILIK